MYGQALHSKPPPRTGTLAPMVTGRTLVGTCVSSNSSGARAYAEWPPTSPSLACAAHPNRHQAYVARHARRQQRTRECHAGAHSAWVRGWAEHLRSQARRRRRKRVHVLVRCHPCVVGRRENRDAARQSRVRLPRRQRPRRRRHRLAVGCIEADCELVAGDDPHVHARVVEQRRGPSELKHSSDKNEQHERADRCEHRAVLAQEVAPQHTRGTSEKAVAQHLGRCWERGWRNLGGEQELHRIWKARGR
eukprot:360721-Chlamydomonas_euryale.AAC.2